MNRGDYSTYSSLWGAVIEPVHSILKIKIPVGDAL